VIVQVLAGDEVTSTSYFYADEVVGARADIPNASYPVQGGTDAVVQPGSSLTRLVGLAAGATPVRYAEVVADDAYGRHLLTGSELGPAGSNGFQGGLLPAFYSTASGFFSYIRPQRGPGDANGASGPDQGTLNTSQGGALLVRAHTTGEILQIRVTATPVDASRRSFVLTTDQSGAGLAFDWILPGGGRSTETSPTYTVPANAVGGSYPVTVGVDRASDGSFGWGQAEVQVGPAPTPSPTPTPSPSPTPGTGGDGPEDDGPTSAPSGSPGADPQPDPSPGTGGPSDGAPTLPPPTTLPPTTPGPDVPTESEPTPTTPAPEPSPAGDEVAGILLTSAQLPDGAPVVIGDPPPSQAARPLADTPFRVSTGIWVAAGALLLLLAGAASESAQVRRWLRRRWSRMSS
jgi:hypothetical protein